jgi:O-antigen ligase
VSKKRKRASARGTNQAGAAVQVVEELPQSPEIQPAPGEPSASGSQPLWRRLLGEPVAWGVAIIVFLRPIRDGITFPTSNTYFLWLILFLFALWAARVLLRSEGIRRGTPLALLGGFLAVAALTGFNTFQADATLSHLMIWSSYLFLFALAANALRTPTALGIVLGSFLIVSFLEALYAVIHLNWILPVTRLKVMSDPSLLLQYFNTTVLTPELADRLNKVRAFGTLLFPNALAGFLILGIPYALFQALSSASSIAEAAHDRGRQKAAPPAPHEAPGVSNPDPQLFKSFLLAAVSWLIAAGFAYILFSFKWEYRRQLGSWTGGHVLFDFVLFAGVIPVAIAGVLLIVGRRYNLHASWLVIVMGLSLMTLVLQLYALWLTYSRGGMLALFGAAVMGAALLGVAYWFSPRFLGHAKSAAAFCLLGTAAALALAASAQETPTPEALSPTVAPQDRLTIDVEGETVSPEQLASTATFGLRLSYWKTGLRMIRDNFWTGVGLGNFGAAYPKYQYLGAGDVREAHNDPLQVFAETGVFGFLFFSAFWLYFLFGGMRRILSEPIRRERWMLTGLFLGVTAFLLHSVVDFDFYNPSLATLVFLFAGLFYARADLRTPAPRPHLTYQLIAIPLLLITALTAGTSVRIWRHDVMVGPESFMNARLMVANDFLAKLASQDHEPESPAVIEDARSLAPLFLVPDSDADLRHIYETFAAIRVLRAGGDRPVYAPLGTTEPLPSAGPYQLVIRDPAAARNTALEAVQAWAAYLQLADSIYDKDPRVAHFIQQLYSTLLRYMNNPEKKREYVLANLEWARETVERSPHEGWYRAPYALALWHRGKLEEGATATQYFREQLEQYRMGTVLYPTSGILHQQYGEALIQFGQALKEAGEEERGIEMIEKGRQTIAYAHRLNENAGEPGSENLQ